MTTFESVRIDVDGELAEIVLQRPELMNRVDTVAHRELVAAFRAFEDLPEVRAIVFRAEGTVFSAGGDFSIMLAANADLAARTQLINEARRLLAALLDVVPPIVVALHGDVLGLGATLVLACEAVVAHPGVRIGDPHVNIGLVAGDGGCLVWPQAVGMLRAKRHLLTGDALTGREAHALGLVTDLVERPDDVAPSARALAERIAALPPLAVQGTKSALNEVLRARFAEVVPISLANELTSLGSEDLREAIAAFKERRPPRYTGH